MSLITQKEIDSTELFNLIPLPPSSTQTISPWQPLHCLNDLPQPPPQDTREAELAALAAQEKLGHDGKRQRVRPRRTVDPFGELERWKIFRTTKTSIADEMYMRSNPSYVINLLPPSAYTNTATSICSRYAHTSTNKIRCPVNIVKWTPDARRVLTGSTSGEFTLWNGLTFNFETILQAHDTAVRALEWSTSGQWLISADNNGIIKYFQSNMNNLQMFQGHNESIRDITWSPNDDRFATGSDDGTIKIWNFEQMKEEKTLTGHGWDVKCVKWHPTKGLLVSGSKDNLVKFWDPRTSKVLTTLHGHKNTVQACAWSPTGNLVATASRDQLVKVFDIRAMKELVTLRGHKKEVCSIAWHPIHDDLLVSGGSEGSIIHWSMPDATPKDVLEFAHDSNVWSLAFHPLGHLLCSASNDHTTRFWSRGRLGTNILGDRFHIGKERARELGTGGREDEDDENDFVPGLNAQPYRNNRNNNNNNNNNTHQNNNHNNNNNNNQNSYQNNNNNNGNNNNNNNNQNYRPTYQPPPENMAGSFIPGFSTNARPQLNENNNNNNNGNFTPPSSYGGNNNNNNNGGNNGMRRTGPLPSQQAALDGSGGSGGGGGNDRVRNYGRDRDGNGGGNNDRGRGRGRGGGGRGGGGGGRPY